MDDNPEDLDVDVEGEDAEPVVDVDTEDAVTRARRLDEERLLVRASATSGFLVAAVTLALVVVAVIRLSGSDSATGPGGLVIGENRVQDVTTTVITLPTTLRPDATTTSTTLPPPIPPDPTTTTLLTTTTLAPTTTLPPAVAKFTWTSNPSAITVRPGGKVTVTVSVRNDGNAVGEVPTPTCMAFAGHLCTQGAPVGISPGGSQQWSFTFWATTSGTQTGSPLGVHDYAVSVGAAPLLLRVR